MLPSTSQTGKTGNADEDAKIYLAIYPTFIFSFVISIPLINGTLKATIPNSLAEALTLSSSTISFKRSRNGDISNPLLVYIFIKRETSFSVLPIISCGSKSKSTSPANILSTEIFFHKSNAKS